jgi:FtsZ-binding cell division protein ZapB
MCLATVEALERENEALKKEMEASSERNRGLERANQKLLNDQHRMREELSELRDMQQLLREVRDTVASWQQRLQGTVDPPNHVDGAPMSAALPAATSVPGMWDTQEEGAGVFNDSDIVPETNNFTHLFEF